MSAAPHLRLVDENGEFVPSQKLEELNALVEKLQGDLKGAEQDLRSKRRQITELQRNKAQERMEHPDREFIKRVCRYWHRAARPEDYNGRRRINPLSPDRFDAVAALAEMQEIVMVDGKRQRAWKYSAEHFKAAVDGGVFDPFVATLKNGKRKPQNDLEQVCRSVSKFEAFVERAPYVVVPLSPGRVCPDALVRGAANCDDPAVVPTTSPWSGGNGKAGGPHAGSLGATARWPYVPLEGRWLHASGRVVSRYSGASAAF